MSWLIGPMLGRMTPLLDVSSGQEFPNDWKYELEALQDIGADCLEWLVTDLDNNPIYTEDLTGYPIHSVNLHSLVEQQPKVEQLKKICYYATRQNILTLVCPMMGASRIDSRNWADIYRKLSAEYPNICFSFETELTASEIMDDLNSCEKFYVTYDTGNTTCYGFDHVTEIRLLRNKINNVHLKDKKKDLEDSVRPFTGDTDFELIFNQLREINYQGRLVLETFRGVAGHEKQTLLQYIKEFRCLI